MQSQDFCVMYSWLKHFIGWVVLRSFPPSAGFALHKYRKPFFSACTLERTSRNPCVLGCKKERGLKRVLHLNIGWPDTSEATFPVAGTLKGITRQDTLGNIKAVLCPILSFFD